MNKATGQHICKSKLILEGGGVEEAGPLRAGRDPHGLAGENHQLQEGNEEEVESKLIREEVHKDKKVNANIRKIVRNTLIPED